MLKHVLSNNRIWMSRLLAYFQFSDGGLQPPGLLPFLALIALILLTSCDGEATAVSFSDPTGTATAVPTATPLPSSPSPTAAPPTTAASTPSPTLTPRPSTPTPLPTATSEPQVYEVHIGDSLTDIAGRFSTTAAAIQIANDLFDANDIFFGQELLIPLAPATAPSTEPEQAGQSATPERGVSHNRFLCPAEEEPVPEGAQLVGRSAVCNLPIVSHKLGDGEISLILVGGIHGGYEWNTILLAYDILDAFNAGELEIPSALSLYLIPNANPDGLYAVSQKVGRFVDADMHEDTVPGRFNGNNVDLNRNWDCKWQPYAKWGDNDISGGTEPFSEQESRILRDHILATSPAVVVFLHSAAHGVFAAGCDEVDITSRELAEVYADASGYPIYDGFQHYEVTGDAGDWLASEKEIPSITIELTDHHYTETKRNLTGLRALMAHLAGQVAESE